MSTQEMPTSATWRGMDVEALHFIAEGVTALAGFELAAISVVEDDYFRVVAVAGSNEASNELMTLRSPIDRVLAELSSAERTGRMMFLPQERSSDQLPEFSWTPVYEVLDSADAWLPADVLCALLHDNEGALQGLLSVDLPTSRRRPDKAALDTLNVYARLAERAVVNFVEREQLATDLALERRLSRYRSHLINVLSHELQTPVTVILGRAELALENATDPGRREDLEAISRAAQRISNMSEDLLVMARVGDPDNPVEAATIDLGALVSECARLFSDMAAQQRIELVVSVPDQAVSAIGSSVELEAMVTNLLSNAVKYSDPGGRVQVAVHSGSPGWVELSVSDDGIGISEEDQRQIFDEFFRSSSPDVRARPGSGLGLAIVDRIIRRHNGRIQIRSELGLGMTVRVELPSAAPTASWQSGEAALVPSAPRP